MRPDTAGLALLAASLVTTALAIFASALFVVAWTFAAWGLVVLARQPHERHRATVALVAFAASLGAGLLSIGLSFGLFGRALGGVDAEGWNDVVMNLALLAPGIGAAIVLTGRPGGRVWGIAGVVAGVLTLAIMAAQIWGDPIGGLVALTGLAVLLAAAAGLAVVLRERRAATA